MQLWCDDQGVGVFYTNVRCAVASAHASYLESTYGEHARAKSNRLRTYQLMNMSNRIRIWVLICTLELFASDHKCSAQEIFVKVQMFKPSFGGRVWKACKARECTERDRVCRVCSLGAVEDEDHLLLVCPTHHDICCKFGQQLGKQLTPAWIDAFDYSESGSFVLSFLPRQHECFAQINKVIVVKWISLVRVLTLN